MSKPKRGTPLRPDVPRTLTIADAARMLGVSPTTVRRDIAAGTNGYEVRRVRGRILIPRAPLERWLNGESHA